MYAERKRVLKGVFVRCIRPETRRATHEQGEGSRNTTGGPNPYQLQLVGMTCE
jgi:hypothetical protein